MWARLGAALIVPLALAACSAAAPTLPGATASAAAPGATVPAPVPVSSPKNLRCKTVLGEVEGFGKESVRSTAEQSRLKAIAAEEAHRKEIGQQVASVDLQETECVAVYPIGAEEWHCMARAKVCAMPAS
jgi:hypothetical protein